MNALSRRDLLRASVLSGAGLFIAFQVPRKAAAAAPEPEPQLLPDSNAFVRVAPDGSVTILLAHSEMGQGIWTGLAMLVAEELDCDWSTIRVEHAPAAPVYAHTKYRMQMTGGSTSTWSEFDRYRDQFREIVMRPDLTSARENELRRALLFLRRGRLWRELPLDTQWWEVELQDSDLDRLRIFPRNHWRRLADGNFYLSEMVDNIRERVESDPSDPFAVKLLSVTEELASAAQESSAVLLIGVDEVGPLTIIEGNHRMAAASLLGPSEVRRRFRFLCGLSPHMTECCWYQTDLATLWRYARNFVTYFLDDHDVIIEQALRRRLEQRARASESA